jgi:phosphopantothenoylcysteine decarboxylase/phosphopantothenate--cysteine ligase
MTESAPPRRARQILLCASGGYQCYSLPGFILALLRHSTDDVRVVLSRAATRLVSRYAVEVASRHPVFVELDDTGEEVYVPHIELARSCDLVLVYPATINVLGKVAQGIADELIPALVLASPAPVFFLPVTNPGMWGHPAVQRNVETLRRDGYAVLAPLPNIEVATREGLSEVPEPFPFPTLLAQISAVVAGNSPAGTVRRAAADGSRTG